MGWNLILLTVSIWGMGGGGGCSSFICREEGIAPRVSWEFHLLSDRRLVVNLLSFATFSQIPEYLFVLVFPKYQNETNKQTKKDFTAECPHRENNMTPNLGKGTQESQHSDNQYMACMENQIFALADQQT